MLEEKGFVGPADGAKPRDVYENATGATKANFGPGTEPSGLDESESPSDSEWQKV